MRSPGGRQSSSRSQKRPKNGRMSEMDARARNNIDSVQVTFRRLFYFVTVAEEQHFRRAAERLHVSQPPLTQRIQTLEHDLGVQLFRRTGNRIELTEGGRLILAEAKVVLAQVDRLKNVAHQIRQGEAGHLQVLVGSSAPLVQGFTEAIEAFQRDHPGVILDLVQTTARSAFEALQEGRIDICVLRSTTSSGVDGVQQMVIARDRLMLVLPSGHPKALAAKVALGDLTKERFIQFPPERSLALYTQTQELWARVGAIPRTVQKAESGLATLTLVAAGLGNAILPSTLSTVQVPKVVWKPIDI